MTVRLFLQRLIFILLRVQKDVEKAEQELNTVSKDTGSGTADRDTTTQHLKMYEESYTF